MHAATVCVLSDYAKGTLARAQGLVQACRDAGLPVLVLFSILVGWFGGAIVAVFNQKISITFQAFFSTLRDVVDAGDVANGLFKTLVFAVVIGTVSCHQGLITIGGPRGIGRSVTKAVVNSIVLILILDYFVTRFLMFFEK